jgi:hypothetical protein
MKFYSTLAQVPEVQSAPPEDRARLCSWGYRRSLRCWQTWLAAASIAALAALGAHVAPFGYGLGIALGVVVFTQVMIHMARRAIRAR